MAITDWLALAKSYSTKYLKSPSAGAELVTQTPAPVQVKVSRALPSVRDASLQQILDMSKAVGMSYAGTAESYWKIKDAYDQNQGVLQTPGSLLGTGTGGSASGSGSTFLQKIAPFPTITGAVGATSLLGKAYSWIDSNLFSGFLPGSQSFSDVVETKMLTKLDTQASRIPLLAEKERLNISEDLQRSIPFIETSPSSPFYDVYAEPLRQAREEAEYLRQFADIQTQEDALIRSLEGQGYTPVEAASIVDTAKTEAAQNATSLVSGSSWFNNLFSGVGKYGTAAVIGGGVLALYLIFRKK